MPTYEYACRTCGHRFEIWQSFTDDPLSICDVCGGELRKVFTAPAISFKGSGFYSTDHGKKSKPAEKDTKPAEKKSDEKPSTGGGDAKPAASEPSKKKKETTAT